jgi:hypothetical protein
VPGSVEPYGEFRGTGGAGCPDCEDGVRDASLDLAGIDWVIVGGESGPKARPMRLGWARDVVTTARDAGTAPFVKQLGRVAGREFGAGAKGGDIDKWPSDLRVREFPKVIAA